MIHLNSCEVVRYPERAANWAKSSVKVSSRRFGMIRVSHFFLEASTEAARGHRIAYISDLHRRNGRKSTAILQDAARAVKSYNCRFLLSGGDLIGDCSEISCLSDTLHTLRDCTPHFYAVLGNHERAKKWIKKDFWSEIYANCDVKLLSDESLDDGIFGILGKKDTNNNGKIKSIPPLADRENILLTHNPDAVIALDRQNYFNSISLAICGHTHGGQVRFRAKPMLAASRYGKYFDYGFYRNRNNPSRMIISAGLGNLTFPIRINCPYEVVIVDFT